MQIAVRVTQHPRNFRSSATVPSHMHSLNKLLGLFGLNLSRAYPATARLATPEPALGEVVIGGRALMAPLTGTWFEPTSRIRPT